MPVKSLPKKNEKRMKTKPVYSGIHIQVGYIHNPVNLFWVLRLITCMNVEKKKKQPPHVI